MPGTCAPRPPRVVGRGVGLLAGVLLAGCAGPPAAAPAPTGATGAPGTVAPPVASPDAGAPLDAEVVQYRRDAQRDVVQVKVTNHGPDPVHVERVEVRSDTFATAATVAKDSRVGAGLAVDLTVPLAPPACPDVRTAEAGVPATDASTAAPGATVLLEVDGGDVRLPVDDDVLQQVRAQRCAERSVGELVDLVWEPTWQEAGAVDGEPGLRGRLRATPRGSGPVGLRVEGATTLFTVERVARAVVTDGPVGLDVVVTVTRCDPHAVAEDKKGYLFPVRVRTPDGAEVLLEVAVPVPERPPLQALIERSCY